MVIKNNFLIKCNAKEFDSCDFCKNWITNSNVNCIFLVGDYHIWSLADVERKSVCLKPVINAYHAGPYSQWHAWTLTTMGCKNCPIISKMNKTQLIWGSIHVIDIQKKKYWAQHRTLWNTQCNVWHRRIAVSDWDALFPVTQIRLKPVLHDTSDVIMQELTHQYVMINSVECFWEI